MVLTQNFEAPAVDREQILRFAGCKEPDRELEKLLEACLQESLSQLSYKVCHLTLPVTVQENVCDFGLFSISSQALARNLSGCSQAVLFAATVGLGIDRLIARYGPVAPTKALLFQAIGAERIESLCDAFCATLPAHKPRFSAGFGDVPLQTQKLFFDLLDCGRRIGLTLNSSFLMSPTKSVTAFVGIK